MNLGKTAQLLDGSPRIERAVNLFSFGEPEMRWLCWLYGYRLEHFKQYSDRFSSAAVRAVLDSDPRARIRGDWMRAPELRPGVPAPVPWTWTPPGQGTHVWTPPGWPPGTGPVRPAPDRMPMPSEAEILATHNPRALLRLGAACGVVALALAWSVPVAGALFGVLAAACLLGVRPFTRYRDGLLARAAEHRPMYPGYPAVEPRPGLPPGPPEAGHTDRDAGRRATP
ncbi:NfeD family protein [Kitasatospora sp. NPDC090091]|uniref:NfeD family protein n=1 Tax=Kitasatospora sp. NPDC090091 TaxID=3364081 RepID=UPI00381A6F3C